MNICTYFHLLLYTLIALQISYTAAATIGIERSESNEVKNSDSSILSNPSLLEKVFKSNGSGKFKEIIINEIISPSKSSSAVELIKKGYAFKNQYGLMLAKLSEMMLQGRSSINFFGIMRVLPYVILALQKVNNPPSNTTQDSSISLKNFNLASVLENPENVLKLFSDENRGNLATGAVKLLAGQDASETIEKLMKEVKANASDVKDGKVGIDGKHLVRTMLGSDNMKHLFPTEESATKAAGFINAYMDSMSNLENQNTNNTESGPRNDQGDYNSVNGKIHGTLMDSVTTFFKTGKKIMSKQLQSINSDADKNIEDWKQLSSDGINDGTIKNRVLKNTPSAVLKIIATANVLKKQHANALLPYIAHYFLPVGTAMDALKFMSLVTYVILEAQKELNIPGIEIDNFQSLPGLNTEKIINTLNDKEIMEKLFPFKDQSSKSTVMLKFLAGPEAMVVDEFVDEIKKIKSDTNLAQSKITIYDLFTNAAFIKKTWSIINSIDAKLKSSLGLDIGSLRKEILDEINKYNAKDGKADSYFRTLVNMLSATSTVSIRKSKNQFKTISEALQEEADRMTQKPNSSETERTGARFFRYAASMAPRPALYGVAAANKIATTLVTSLFPDKAEPITKNGDTNVPILELKVS